MNCKQNDRIKNKSDIFVATYYEIIGILNLPFFGALAKIFAGQDVFSKILTNHFLKIKN